MPPPHSAHGLRWMEPWTAEQGAAAATGLLRDHGVDGKARVWSAPGKVTIIGDYTDIGAGIALPTVLPHRTYVAAALRSDDRVRIISATERVDDGSSAVWETALDEIGDAPELHGWMSYPAGVMWALQERGFAGRGVDIAIASCVPMAANLASSAALSAATALALNDLWDVSLRTGRDADELAEVCVDAENEMAHSATAGLDQHAVLRCQEGEALLLDFATSPVTAEPYPLYFPEYGLCLLIINTGVREPAMAAMVRIRIQEAQAAAKALGVPHLRSLADRPDGPKLVAGLEDPLLRRRAKHVLSEIERVELVRDELSGTAPAHERFIAIGKAMFRSHASLEADLEVSTDALNLAVDTAFHAGALGARLLGPGGGGSACALVRRSGVERTAAVIDQAFAKAGLNRPSFAIV